MAYKKDIKPWLKEIGLTWEQMDKIWEEVCEVNWKCKALRNAGKTWDKLDMSIIKQLPTLKETTLKQLEEEARQLVLEAEQKEKEIEAEKYYKEHFEEIMLSKIDLGENLTEDELKELVFEYTWDEVDAGGKLRWTQPKCTIIKLDNRYFRINWQEALTEMQENSFDNQPVEVEQYERIVVIRDWRDI